VHKIMKNKLNYLKAALVVLALLCVPALSQAQQNLLVQTTLSVAQAAPATPGAAPVPYGTVQIASSTGIVGYSLNPTQTINAQQLWVLYIDREEEAVITVQGAVLSVIRGYNSTVATSHVAGTMVLYGKAAWFYNYDPGAILEQGGTSAVSGGTACVLATVFAHPWVNVRTGEQFICSTDTLSWVPGFNQGFGAGGNNVPTAGTEASVAGTNAVLGPVFAISGTNAIVTFTPPVGFNTTAAGGGCFTVIPKGIFTWTAAGNISVAGTTTAITQNVTFCWNPYTSKWVPSRVS
jgi:hypothetical protein